MIAMRDAMRAVKRHDRGDVVLTTETAIWAWEDVLDDPDRHLPIPAMSKGSSVALGVALAHPERRVVLWDGDGGLLMNLGGLVTVAGASPKNLYHVVLDNGVYAMTGGQPTPNADRLSYAEMGQGAGYASTFEFDDLEAKSRKVGLELGPQFECVHLIGNNELPGETEERLKQAPPFEIQQDGGVGDDDDHGPAVL